MNRLLIVALFALTPARVFAQETRDAASPIPPDEASGISLRFAPYAFASTTADLDGGGDVGLRRAGWQLGLSTPISERWRFDFDFINEYAFHDISAAGALGGGDPFDTLIGAQLLPSFLWIGPGKWSWRFGGRIEYAAEEGADFGESIIGGVFAAFRRQETENFSWGLGAAVFSRFEDSVWVIPLPVISWRVSETLFIYSERVGVNVEGKITDDWFLTLKARWQPREYRLSDDSSAILPGGVLRDESVLVGLELAWRPRPRVEAALELGGVVYQEFELLDSRGNTQFDDNTDPLAYIAARVQFTF